MSKQTTSELTAVIMAGGAGTRFWPVSTETRPKQFLSLLGERTLIQQSFDRLEGLVPPQRVLVLTAERFVELVREQLPEIPAGNIIGEPLRRDTGAAVALAAALCKKRFGDGGTMAVLTADHLIQPIERFQADLRSAVKGLSDDPDALYTFGISPTQPSTAYGYLQRGAALPVIDGVEHYELRRFREKPDAPTARRYLDSGEFYWNSGMFLWTVRGIIAELERNLPEHLSRLEQAAQSDGTALWGEALRRAFEPLELISIDYGVMEKAQKVRCVAACFGWSDVGGWLALEDHLPKDETENAARGALHLIDSKNNIVFCEDSTEHVALIGVENLIVVRAGDKTLVLPRERAEEIKQLVKQLDEPLR